MKRRWRFTLLPVALLLALSDRIGKPAGPSGRDGSPGGCPGRIPADSGWNLPDGES